METQEQLDISAARFGGLVRDFIPARIEVRCSPGLMEQHAQLLQNLADAENQCQQAIAELAAAGFALVRLLYIHPETKKLVRNFVLMNVGEALSMHAGGDLSATVSFPTTVSPQQEPLEGGGQ